MAIVIDKIRRYSPTSSLKARMIFLVFLLVLALTLVAGGMYATLIRGVVIEQIGKRALQISQTVAKIPLVQQQIIKPHFEGKLQQLAEDIRLEVGAEFIVIRNQNGILFSHPKPDRLGKQIVDGGNAVALDQVESYNSHSTCLPGSSIYGKVPIFNSDQEIVGVVFVGYSQENVLSIVHKQQLRGAILTGWLMLFGILGAIMVSSRLKQAIFKLEPKQIAHLFSERASIIESIREGIIAIDRDAQVTVVNGVAIEGLEQTREENIIGQSINEILPGAKLDKVLSSGHKYYDREVEMFGTMMIINAVPMVEKGKVIGAVASFRRKDELDILAKQLLQIKDYSEMLRTQTHEYSNKLHTIAGLIQTGHKDEALDLISKETAGYQGLIAFLAKAVPHTVLAACIIGKYNYAQELRVDLIIDPESQLIDVPADLNLEKVVTILGNLINNAFDATLLSENKPQVTISMTDFGNDLVFEIGDSGLGVPQEIAEKIFERGFTTKRKERGYGLYLVMQTLNDLQGQITLGDSELGGALFTVFIPKRKNWISEWARE